MAPPPTHINPINNSALSGIPLSAEQAANRLQGLREDDQQALRDLAAPPLQLFDGITPVDNLPIPMQKKSRFLA